MKLSDIRADGWPAIESLLAAGGEPELKYLVEALGRGEAVPAAVQAYIADLLTSKKKRGRKKVPRGHHPAFYPALKRQIQALEDHCLIIAVIDGARQFPNVKNPIQSAINEVAKHRNRAPLTVRRYFKAACRRLPWAVEEARQNK